LPTAALLLIREKAKRLFATESLLANVINGSATRLSSFAFGTVVLMTSCSIKEQAILRNIAFR
jgi:hypothetical protein